MKTEQADFLRNRIDEEIQFHRFWQTTTMRLYVTISTLTMAASSGATIMAALEKSLIASGLAGMATVLIGIEKTLLFREKWKLHLKVHTLLKNLQHKFVLGLIEQSHASCELETILVNYSRELPFGERTCEASADNISTDNIQNKNGTN